jgi:DNA-binding MarR family transcriptional regulator
VEPSGGEQIAAGLHAASLLLVRHLSYGQGQGLTASLVLAHLDEGPARISVLAAAGGVSQPSMTELVGRLEREGLVTRFSDPADGRATLVAITPSGSARRKDVHRSIHDRVIELLEMLPTEDHETLRLTMRVALPLIEQLTQLAARHPHPSGDRSSATA